MPASLVQPEAEIDVVEGDRKIAFVETADSEEAIAGHDKTCAGHGGGKLGQGMPAEIASGIAVEISGVRKKAEDKPAV